MRIFAKQGVLLVLLALASAPAWARSFHSEAWAREKYASAERAREALNGRLAKERSRRDYQQAIDAYRRVYFGSPTSTKADPSVVATAAIMLEMGRQFDDEKILRSAIKQYEFLRREYPSSKGRFDALFTIGEIYKEDLDDFAAARASFQEFLRRYPHHHLADDARSALAEMDQAARSASSRRTVKGTAPENPVADDSSEPNAPRKGYSRVTGIRHWSTPDYTRVAIDLQQPAKFDSQRLDHPDRIFFDLYDTRLASTLIGKSFDIGDGLLRKIRVAQFQPGKARVVLEVDDLSRYNAFIAQNPTRLLIDIHGNKPAKNAAEQSKVPEKGPELPQAAAIDNRDSIAEESDALAAGAPPATPLKAAVAEEGIPKRIVEADDDDPDYEGAIKNARVTAKALNLPSAKRQAEPAESPVANAATRKLKAPDGDDDEIATLNAADEAAAAKAMPKSDDKSSRPAKATRSGMRQAPAELQVREAQPTAAGDRSLIRALGLKIGRIVIDPGHGGHDTGTIGPNGLEEKNLVLDVARRLGKLLEVRMGADVVFTRDDDTFIPLETRTAIANRQQADLFISVHANSSRDPDARGVETYYLNFTSNADALEVAARENAVSDKSIHELQDLVKKIALKEKIEESHEFASDVQRSLHKGLAVKSPGLRDRGVKKAPFIVLIGANMPSILAEISFVSNPTDARKLQTPEYRQRIAESLYRGISKYVSGLSGVKVASRMAKSDAR
ncbi:MAG TPA: N-acetylmuramoyl-L-alanine amidase [Terriglobales bacterium]|nr:N-acetylmuramoyl-L-alanine amidase [Terriglobales bacterium]